MFGQKIKELREKEFLTQVKFAKIIGVSQPTVAAWELETREPNIDALIKIAKHFNISVDYLVGNNFSDIEKRIQHMSTYERELLKLFTPLTTDYKTQILEYTRYIAFRTKQIPFKKENKF